VYEPVSRNRGKSHKGRIAEEMKVMTEKEICLQNKELQDDQTAVKSWQRNKQWGVLLGKTCRRKRVENSGARMAS